MLWAGSFALASSARIWVFFLLFGSRLTFNAVDCRDLEIGRNGLLLQLCLFVFFLLFLFSAFFSGFGVQQDRPAWANGFSCSEGCFIRAWSHFGLSESLLDLCTFRQLPRAYEHTWYGLEPMPEIRRVDGAKWCSEVLEDRSPDEALSNFS